MANKFKAGDKVRYVRGGKIGWETEDYGCMVGLIIGNVYTTKRCEIIEGCDVMSIYELRDYHHPDHFELVACEGNDVKVTGCWDCPFLDTTQSGDCFCTKQGDITMSRYNIHETIPSNCPMLGKSLTFKWSEK